jgi:hypothetical protein
MQVASFWENVLRETLKLKKRLEESTVKTYVLGEWSFFNYSFQVRAEISHYEFLHALIAGCYLKGQKL